MSLPSPDPNSTVLITGASAGIGVELAKNLASRGYNLTLVARRKERLQSLAADLRARHGVRVDTKKVDLTKRSARTKLVESLNEGDLNVVGVCNNAGYGSTGYFAKLALEQEQDQVELNVVALHELTGAFLPQMIERGGGAVLNVASVAAFQPIPGMATYAATKAFVLSFSEALANELGDTGVSVSTLCPGVTPTEFSGVAGNKDLEDSVPGVFTTSAEEVAAAGVNAMIEGKRTVTPGVHNKFASMAGRYTPRTLLLPVLGRAGTSR